MVGGGGEGVVSMCWRVASILAATFVESVDLDVSVAAVDVDVDVVVA